MEGTSGRSARDRILEDIRRHPGSSGRDIQHRLDLGWGDVAYHLDRLARGELVRRERGGWRDYYFARELTLADRRIFQALRSPAERQLVLSILQAPGASFTALVQATGMAKSTVSFHLRKLVELGVLADPRGESNGGFRVMDEARIRLLLTTYRASIADELVDRLVGALSGLVSP